MDEWEQFLRLARRLSDRMFKQELVQIELKFEGGDISVLPVPRIKKADEQIDSPWHSGDFREVAWPKLGRFRLTGYQAIIVSLLWQAWKDGGKDLAQDELLRAAGSDCVRLVDVFKRSPAWGTLVVSTRRGFYHLPSNCELN